MKTNETKSEKIACLIALAFLGLFAFGLFNAMQTETKAFNECEKDTYACTQLIK